MGSNVFWSVGRRLGGYLAPVRRTFALSLLLLAAATALTAAKAWIVQPAVDGFVAGPVDPSRPLILAAVVFAIFALQALFNWLYLIVAKMAGAGVIREIRADLFRHLQRHSLGYFDRHRSSDLVSRIINDVSVFELSAVVALQGLLRNGFTLAFLLGVLLVQDVRWGLLAFLGMLVAAWILGWMGNRIAAIARGVQESIGRVTHHLTEMTGGIAVILGFGATSDFNARFADTNQRHYRMQVRFTQTRASATALVDLVTGAALAVILWLMGAALLAGDLTPGQLLSFLAVLFLMQAPAQRMAQAVAGLARGFAAGGRALELLDEPPEITDPEQPRPLPAGAGALTFRAVTFAYDTVPVLEDLSFEVRPGELVVMVGASGAGKSTVARLVQRFHDPSSGRVLLDGVDLRELRRGDLYRAVSHVTQEVFLFDDTIERNLTVGAPDATPDQIDEVVRLACLDDVVAELPDGLQTVVGERGIRLSGGQRQRIAIARAALTGARLLVLDEATSALDMDLEQRVLQNLVSARRARTILAISHRLTLAEVADRVVVLRGGRLVEEGDPASLVTAGGEFRRLQLAAEASLVR